MRSSIAATFACSCLCYVINCCFLLSLSPHIGWPCADSVPSGTPYHHRISADSLICSISYRIQCRLAKASCFMMVSRCCRFSRRDSQRKGYEALDTVMSLRPYSERAGFVWRFYVGLCSFLKRLPHSGIIDQGIGLALLKQNFLPQSLPSQRFILNHLDICAHHTQLSEVFHVPPGA